MIIFGIELYQRRYYSFFFFSTVALGTWFEHVLEYSKHQREDNFLFLKYEDLHKVLQ